MQKAEFWGRLLLLMAMAFLINSFIYFSFANTYSSAIINIQSFEAQFQAGIYQYRILSGYLFRLTYDFITGLHLNYEVFALKFLNKESEVPALLSFYALNTLFLIASAVVLNSILGSKKMLGTSAEKVMAGLMILFTMGLTQFVMVPYDVSSYFFLLLFFLLFLKYLEKSTPALLFLLCLLVVLSALNRETAALSIAVAATLLYSRFGLSRKSLLPILALVGSFLGVYLGLRWMNASFSTNDGNLLLQNFTEPKNLLGLAFWVVFFLFALFVAKGKAQRKLILLFHLCSAPYIFMCFYTGIIYEVRLYVPLFTVSMLLAHLKLQQTNRY